MKNYKSIYMYSLLLEAGKYYIGITSNFEKRMIKHFSERGSQWTKEHAPIEIIHKIDLGIYIRSEAYLIENDYTLEFMSKHGWQNVRGGKWYNLIIKKPSELNSYPWKDIDSFRARDFNCISNKLSDEYLHKIKAKIIPINDTDRLIFYSNKD